MVICSIRLREGLSCAMLRLAARRRDWRLGSIEPIHSSDPIERAAGQPRIEHYAEKGKGVKVRAGVSLTLLAFGNYWRRNTGVRLNFSNAAPSFRQ